MSRLNGLNLGSGGLNVQRRGHARRVFAGSNSAYGFHSFFDEILDPDAARVFVVKGGPGAGKSTLMRCIAEDLLAGGFDVDILHCSSDTASMDGFVAPALGVAMIDGTAPHTLDPRYPGAVDEIVDLGAFWDEERLRSARREIVRLTDANRASYVHVYNYLAAARLFYADIRQHIARCGARNTAALHVLAADLVWEVLGSLERRPRRGRNRRLFASAITPDGFRNFMDTIFHPLRKRYVIRGQWGTGKSTIVGRLRDEALTLGYDVESFHCALDPHRIEHLVIPELGVGVITSEYPHTFEPRGDDVLIDTAQAVDARALARASGDLNASREMYGRAMEMAIAWLARAKAIHDELERLYVDGMDFAAVDDLRRDLLARIHAVAGRAGRLQTTPADLPGGEA